MFRRIDRAIIAFGICLGTTLAGTEAADAAPACTLGRIASIDAPIENGRIVVTAELNGRPTRLMVDTGSPFDMLSESVADELQLNRARMRTSTVADIAGSKPLSVAYVGTIALAGMTAERVRFLIEPSWNPGPAKVDGVFSENYLTPYDVEFDFAKGKLNLFQQNEACGDRVVYWADEFVEIPFKLDYSRHIVFPVKLDGKEVTAMIDTGATGVLLHSIVAEDKFGVRPPKNDDQQHSPSGANGARRVATYETNFGDLNMGGIEFKNITVVIIPDPTTRLYDFDKAKAAQPQLNSNIKADVIIGLNQLSALHLFIAYSQKKLYATSATARR